MLLFDSHFKLLMVSPISDCNTLHYNLAYSYNNTITMDINTLKHSFFFPGLLHFCGNVSVSFSTSIYFPFCTHLNVSKREDCITDSKKIATTNI